MFHKMLCAVSSVALSLMLGGTAQADPQVADSPGISVYPADPAVAYPPGYRNGNVSERPNPRYIYRPRVWYRWYDVPRYPSRYNAGFRYYGPTYYGPTYYYNYGFPPYYYNYGWPGF